MKLEIGLVLETPGLISVEYPLVFDVLIDPLVIQAIDLIIDEDYFLFLELHLS